MQLSIPALPPSSARTPMYCKAEKLIMEPRSITVSVTSYLTSKSLKERIEAVILQFTVGKNVIADDSIHAIVNELPVIIKDCQPRLAEGQIAVEIKANLDRYSRRFEQ